MQGSLNSVESSNIGKSKNGFLNKYVRVCMFIYACMHCIWEHRLTCTHSFRSKRSALCFVLQNPPALYSGWGPASGLVEPLLGHPVRPGELPVSVSLAHWLHACTTTHLIFLWVLGHWLQGLKLGQQACYQLSHPSCPGLGFEIREACQSPWNIRGYLSGWV